MNSQLTITGNIDLQGSAGATGPQGSQGYQGPQGVQGKTGPQGTQGYQGTVGSQGPQGYQGVQGGLGSGAQGSQGYQGPQGTQGSQGFQGPQGVQGYQGKIGTAPAGQIFLSCAGGWPQSTSACGVNTLYELTTNKVNLYVMNFADTVNTYANWDLVMPSDWDAGAVTAYPYWTSTAFGVDIGVCWKFGGRSYANDDALDQAWPYGISAGMSGGTNNDLYIGSSLIAGISGAGANELVVYQLGRMGNDATDSLTAAASLIGIRLDYTRS